MLFQGVGGDAFKLLNNIADHCIVGLKCIRFCFTSSIKFLYYFQTMLIEDVRRISVGRWLHPLILNSVFSFCTFIRSVCIKSQFGHIMPHLMWFDNVCGKKLSTFPIIVLKMLQLRSSWSNWWPSLVCPNCRNRKKLMCTKFSATSFKP